MEDRIFTNQATMNLPKSVVIAGAGGFIGGHLVRNFLAQGIERVRAVDIKPLGEWHQIFPQAENLCLDLNLLEACREAVNGVDSVMNLAAEMGGMGFIEHNKAICMLNVLINTHLLQACREKGVGHFFYTSTACVYAAGKQGRPDNDGLVESDAYPAMPEDGYGWEKLFGERMCRHFQEDFGIQSRVVRLHNVYGPEGTWDGGREKAPAAICRKVAQAKLSGRHEIEIWGDGEQGRSFMYIDDCIDGINRIAFHPEELPPLNLGSSKLITINDLVTIIESIAGITLKRSYRLDAPTGVRGRCSDNTLIRKTIGWEPSLSLKEGLEKTYAWIETQVADNQ